VDRGSVGFAESIKIGEMEFHNCPIRVTDSYFAADGDGLIGSDVFEKFLVGIDFPDEKLKLSELPKRPGEQERELGLTNGDDSDDKQAVENDAQDRYIAPEMQSFTSVFRFGHHLLVPTSIGDVPSKLFVLDTGAVNNVISPSAAEEVTKVQRDPHIIVRNKWDRERGLHREESNPSIRTFKPEEPTNGRVRHNVVQRQRGNGNIGFSRVRHAQDAGHHD